jgi:hypothetical protein
MVSVQDFGRGSMSAQPLSYPELALLCGRPSGVSELRQLSVLETETQDTAQIADSSRFEGHSRLPVPT